MADRLTRLDAGHHLGDMVEVVEGLMDEEAEALGDEDALELGVGLDPGPEADPVTAGLDLALIRVLDPGQSQDLQDLQEEQSQNPSLRQDLHQGQDPSPDQGPTVQLQYLKESLSPDLGRRVSQSLLKMRKELSLHNTVTSDA